MKNQISKKVVILGAGLTGLVVADLLCKAGLDVLVIEKAENVGGLARTFTFAGFKFDLGGHRVCFSRKILLDYIRNVASSEFILKKRKSSIFLKGRYLSYPPCLFSCFRHSLSDIFRIVCEYFKLSGKCKETGNFKQLVISRFGVNIHDLYFRDYSYKVWGLQTDKISSLLAQRRMGRLSSFLMMKEMFTMKSIVKENTRYFYYPREGIGSLSKDLAKSVLKNKGEIVLNADVRQILTGKNNLQSLIYQGGNELINIEFSRIVSTIPLSGLLRLLFPQSSEQGVDLSSLVRYRDLILIFLVLDKKCVFKSQWIYFPDKNIPFARITEPKNWSQTLVKDNKTSLCVEIFCQAEDKYWNASDRDLVNMTVQSLENLNIVTQSEVLCSFVERIPCAYPLMYFNYESDLNVVLSRLSRFKNLWLCGRNGTHSYYDMEDCLMDAYHIQDKVKESFK